MELWRAFWVAFVEGLVEILPISAFGHFEVLKEVMVDSSDAIKMIMRFSCVGTILAIGIFYHREIKKLWSIKNRQEIIWLLLMSMPSAVLFCLLEGKFPSFFYKLIVVGCALLIMSLISINYNKIVKLAQKKTSKDSAMKNSTATVAGLLGAISILPGFSRVAIFMMATRLYGEKRERATKIAIFAGVPVLFAMVGKCLCYGGIDFAVANPLAIALSIAVAFVASMLALRLIKKVEKKHDLLNVFGWYQLIIALVILVFELIK